MDFKDTFYSYKWDRLADESDDAYEQRYSEMTKLFLDDYNNNGETAIINYGFPLTKALLIRVKNYLENPVVYRDKILLKTKEDFIAVTSSTADDLKQEVNVALAGEQLFALRRKRKYDFQLEKEMDRLRFCHCALCVDSGWVNIVYPLYYREKYYKNGFIDKGGHPIRCPACIAFAPKKEEQNMFKGKKRGRDED